MSVFEDDFKKCGTFSLFFRHIITFLLERIAEMKAIKSFLDKILFPASLMFTILAFLLGTISYSTESSYELPVLGLKGMSLILLFSLILSCVNLIFRVKTMHIIARTAIHFAGFVADFVISFILIGGYYSKGTSALMIVFIVSLIYVFIACLTLAFRAVFKAAKKKPEEYRSQFGGMK